MGYKMADLEALQQQFSCNALLAIIGVLADQLGVSIDSLQRLGVGWSITDNAWTFPERDADGKLIGIIRRLWDGRKLAISGSKRGLVYETSDLTDGYDPTRQQWQRVTENDPCPICGRYKWCGKDAQDPPRFVRCMRKAEGAVHKDRADGYIHELIPDSFRPFKQGKTTLSGNPNPVLVVEGASDCAIALDLGFAAVGRPSADGGVSFLRALLVNRAVVVIGENDGGAGQRGMDKVHAALQDVTRSVVKVLPPDDCKDLRAWRQQKNLTTDELLAAIAEGDSNLSDNVLKDKQPLHIAERWLKECHTIKNVLILRKFNGEFVRWNGRAYRTVDEQAILRGNLYHFLEDKQVRRFTAKGEVVVEPYEATRNKVTDILDATTRWCPVEIEPPCWLDETTEPTPENLIVFENGMLDVAEYLEQREILLPPTPQLFIQAALPYNFDPRAKAPRWRKFLNEVFNKDADRIALLQEWFGYNMVADTSFEKMLLFVGRPGSGKGTTLEVLQAILGRHQVAKTTFRSLCGDFGLYPLRGKLAAILPDAHIPKQVDSLQALETIKSIVGRDGVTINGKYLNQIPNVNLSCRFTIAVNELPELPDHARALDRRLLILHFPMTFEGRADTTLKDVLPREAAGVAIWALTGLRRLRQRHTFTEPKSSRIVRDEFRRFVTPIAEFLTECCVVENTTWVSRNIIYDCWRAWCRDHGTRSNTRSRFSQRLLAQIPTCVIQTRQNIIGYMGVNITDEARQRYVISRGR